MLVFSSGWSGSDKLKNVSIMDITKEIERQTQELQKKLALLSDNNLQELVTKKAALETELADIEAKIANTCKLLGISTSGASSPARSERRPRMSGDVISTKINEALKAAPQGLSQIDIANQTGVSYPSVINFLKDNQDTIRTEGARKSKRFFLK
jgi:predicted transcriptional regulator